MQLIETKILDGKGPLRVYYNNGGQEYDLNDWERLNAKGN